MPGSQNHQLKSDLKKLLVETCRKKIPPETIPDDATLIGSDSFLGLDSLDVLEVSVALKKRYGVRVTDSKDALRIMKTIDALADAIEP
ncbi:MAG: acyl carrier protein [Deltaproteobacteria bacterium]|nr:acyl carrier protein [Deltaproteobacteria bacterium]